MWVRERDAIDYAMVGAVTLLVYLRLPFRGWIHETLWSAFESVVTAVEFAVTAVGTSPEAVVAVSVVCVALFGGAFVFGMVRHASG